MGYFVNVAIELERAKLRKLKGIAQLWISARDFDEVSRKTASRLIGASLDVSPLVRQTLVTVGGPDFDQTLKGFRFEHARLYRLKSANPVVVLSLHYEKSEFPAATVRRLSSVRIQKILNSLGLGESIELSSSVYSIVGSIAPVGDEWLPLTKDGWLHIQGGFMDGIILEQVIAQVAIERSIMNFALRKRRWPETLFATPFAAGLIRTWPVQFLSDWQLINDNYATLRDSLNIPNVRTELLERSKHWWIVFSASLAFLALAVAMLALLR